MMSQPEKIKGITNLISGSSNSVQVSGNLNIIGQQINQPISPQRASIFFEVRKPVDSFTGRESELKKLHNLLQRDLKQNEQKSTVISQVSITGLGGIGKSELAKKYSHLHAGDYDGNVIWINAETYGTLTESFQRLASDELNIPNKSIDGQPKNIKSIVKQVYGYFSNRKSLFIFDNAERLRRGNNQEGAIDEFLPNFQSYGDNKPYILITSRNQNWGKHIPVIKLDILTEEEAIEFIRNELEISDESQKKEIRQLAKTLQCYPLALQQAVAYIKQQDRHLSYVTDKFQISNYLRNFDDNARSLLNFNFPGDNDNDYIKTTFITWEITIKKIRNSQYGLEALEILKTMAYFASDNIPTEIFLHVNDDPNKIGIIIDLIVQYSMATVEKRMIQIHRLVQQVIRLKLQEQQKEEETMRKALELVKRTMGNKKTITSQYLSHAIFAWNHASNINDEKLRVELIKFSSRITNELILNYRHREVNSFVMEILKLLRLEPKLGSSLEFDKDYELNLVQSNQVNLEILINVHKGTSSVIGKEHPSTLTTRNNMALVLDSQGRRDEALRIYQEVLEIRERVLGKEHPDTLTTRNNMALVLNSQGRRDDALRIYQEVLEIEERVLGKEHPDTLITRNNMASVLNRQGRHDEALRIYQEVLEIEERVLGKEHPDTLTTRNNMASVLNSQGRYDEALRIYQEVLEIEERILGKEHPDTLTTRNNMALVLDSQGRRDEALRIYQEVLEIRERVLGKEHPDTLTTRNNMALVLNSQGRRDDALRIYQEVLEIEERVLGKEHPDTLITRNNMASVLNRQGRRDDALRIYQEVLEIEERVLGKEHPDTLITRNNMASVLNRQGRHDEALRIYQEVLEIRERVLGKEHPSTLTTRNNMASVLNSQGRYDEALRIYQEVLEIEERILGKEHPDTLITRNNMASVLDRQGRHDEALRIYQEVLEIRERVLGKEHPSTLTTKNCLAFAKRARIA